MTAREAAYVMMAACLVASAAVWGWAGFGYSLVGCVIAAVMINLVER